MEPVWSPDGEKIAFRRDSVEITYTYPTSDASSTAQPVGSAQPGPVVASASSEALNGIYVMNADGTGLCKLPNTPTGAGSFPTFSPDGEKVAFWAFALYVINADGTGQTRLTDAKALEDFPTWSPDGEKIAFIADDREGTDLYVINADGTDRTRLAGNLRAPSRVTPVSPWVAPVSWGRG